MKRILLFVFSNIIVITCFAQPDSLGKITPDSVLMEPATTPAFLRQKDSLRLTDSIQEAALQSEIDELKASEKTRKTMLKMRLDSMKRANNERSILMQHRIDSLRATTRGVPVLFFKDTLFYVYNKLGPYSSAQRAKHTEENLLKIEEGDNFEPDVLIVVESDATHDIAYHNLIVLSVTDADAFWVGKTRGELAKEYRDLIAESISKYRDQHSFLSALIRVGLLIIVLIILYLAIKLMNQGFTRLNIAVMKRSSKYIHGVKIRNYEVIKPARMRQIIRFVLRVIKWLMILVIVYFSLPTIFSIFPATEGLATKLLGYVIDPLKSMVMAFVRYIPEMITIVVILGVVHYIVRFLKSLAVEASNGSIEFPGFYPEWAIPTFNLLRVVIYAFAFVLIFPYLPGSSSPVFRGVSIFFGLLISLGSTSAVGNIVAGLVITYMRPFRIGDRVKIGNVVGDVIEKNLLVTRVRTTKNEDVSIPNASILTGSTINYSVNAQDSGLILHTTVTIGYNESWRTIHELLIAAAVETDAVSKEPKPFVLQTSLDDFYVSYQINVYTMHPNSQTQIYSDLHANIQDKFIEANIEIMSPHYRAERDGNETAMPKRDSGRKFKKAQSGDDEEKTDNPGK